MSLRIAGTGSAIPKKVLTNDDLCKMVDTTDEWITTRTGIKERHLLTDETLSEIGAQAARNALENANMRPEDVEMIICTTAASEWVTPALACMIAKELKISCPAFDLNAACAGFTYGLDTAAGFLARGRYKCILLVAAEGLSYITDWEERSTCVLFGDGSGAAVLVPGDDLIDSELICEPDSSLLHAGSNLDSPFSTTEKLRPYLNMDGPGVYKFAVRTMLKGMKTLIKRNDLTFEDIDYFLVHQANKRIIDAARARAKQPEEKFPLTIQEYGNTSSASVPMLMDRCNRSGLLKKGQLLLMSAFGAGLTNGTILLRWNA